jgi:type III pantothenate kinase
MSVRRLLLDAGNSRLKWAMVTDGEWQTQGSAHYGDLAAFSSVLADGETVCYGASVARAQHEAEIMALLAPYSIEPNWLVSTARFGEVTNPYAQPQQLGVDRWMGLIAARGRSRAATLVVSAGTAMTVDALAPDGRFLGGLIVPGITLMSRALQQGTGHVIAVDGARQPFPCNTADAVYSGIMAALSGAVQRQFAHLAEVTGAVPHCIVTGGDADALAPTLDFSVEQVPSLVLEGLERVTRGCESR